MIPRAHRPTARAFREEFARPGRPVILTGLTEGWRARGWTPEELARRCGEAEVELTAHGAYTEGTLRTSFRDYVERLRAGTDYYLTSWCFRRHCPELLEDFEVPEYFRDDWLELLPERNDMLWLFLGPPGVGMGLHVDLGHTAAWNAQVTGRKRWALVPPHFEDRVYDGEVDAFNPDLDEFPEFAGVEVLEDVVEAGEVLFIPGGWWHQTENLETGFAITANYVDETNYRTVMACLEEYGETDLLEALEQVARQRTGRP